MRIISLTENELCFIRRQASTADGKQIFVYAVYRAMTPYELESLRAGHPYDIDMLDQLHPAMPRQQRLTAADFAAMAVGQTWECTEAHAVELEGRYNIDDFYAGGTRLKPVDFHITADSITAITTDPATAGTVRKTTAYTYRPNGFYIETAGTAVMKIISLTADEMRICCETVDPESGNKVKLYCVYRRMTPGKTDTDTESDSTRTATREETGM